MNYISELQFMELAHFYYPPYDNFRLGSVNPNGLYNMDDMFDGCILYLHYNYVIEFIEQILPRINHKFKIISGISDYLVPYLFEPDRDIRTDILLNNDKLISWYGLNVTVPHAKIKSIPIGIPRSLPFIITQDESNFMGWQSDNWGSDTVKNTIENIMKDKNILDVMRSKINSDKLLYANYTTMNSDVPSFRENKDFRRKLDEYLLTTPFKKEKKLRQWVENIHIAHTYKYVIEPFGRCFDGYRLWETLLVGTIPIVFSSPISELYDDLPVLVIDCFEKINEKYLNEEYEKLVNRTDYKFEKLFMDYWKEKVLHNAGTASGVHPGSAV